MDIVGISEEEQVSLPKSSKKFVLAIAFIWFVIFFPIQVAIFKVVAAILHLGNVEFAKGKEIDSSVIKDEQSRFHLDMTAELLEYAPV